MKFIVVAMLGLYGGLSVAGEKLARCTLKVNKQTYYEDKACVFQSIDKEGSFTIGVSENAQRAAKNFAYVLVENGVGTGYWNGPEGGSHAHEDLGTLVNLRDGCWTNDRAVVCAK